MNRIFDQFIELAQKASLDSGTLKSKEKFRRQVSTKSHLTNIEAITKNLPSVGKLKPGLLVTYEYDPKLKDSLPYWDRYPLIFVINVNKDGWIGLNVHYLHPAQRSKLFYDYQKTGKAFIEHDVSKKALKKYLAKHVVTKPKEIPSYLWEIAIQLPYEDFQGMSSRGVWNQTSRRK